MHIISHPNLHNEDVTSTRFDQTGTRMHVCARTQRSAIHLHQNKVKYLCHQLLLRWGDKNHLESTTHPRKHRYFASFHHKHYNMIEPNYYIHGLILKPNPSMEKAQGRRRHPVHLYQRRKPEDDCTIQCIFISGESPRTTTPSSASSSAKKARGRRRHRVHLQAQTASTSAAPLGKRKWPVSCAMEIFHHVR